MWVPKYRARILGGEVSRYLKKVFREIAQEYEFTIVTIEIMEDHVHMLIEAPPAYSPSHVVQVMKRVSAREL